MLNGERPHLVTVEQRRAVDTESLYEKYFPEETKREQALLAAGARWEDDFFKSSRGLSLATRTFLPNAETENDVGIIVCHGYTEHFRWLLKSLFFQYAERGHLVTGLEMEGHGLSDHTSGLLPDLNKAVDDFHEFVKRQQQRYPKKRWFIQGQSMGGAVALLESLKAKGTNDIQLDGMVLIAPMCKMAKEIQPSKLTVNILLLMAAYLPELSIVPSAIENKLIFRDPEVIKVVSKDPICYIGKPRVATGATMYSTTMELADSMDKIEVPFLVMHGKKDIVTSFQASVDLYEQSTKVSAEDKELVLLEEAWHGVIWAEPAEDVEKYWEIIFQWIDSRCV